jgi:dTDP-4-dehydrorhamnose 3,5-epimerase
VVESAPISDRRGAFCRLYCEQELAPVLGNRHIVQINLSRSTKAGTVRGLHFQRPPYAEMKLVRCLKGAVWDVAVDLRKNSPTFLLWYAEKLTPDNALMLVIPEGFAHGFQALEADTELLYLHTEFYRPDAEAGIRVDDPLLNIGWPMPVSELSERDLSLPAITAEFSGLAI